jgi:hypothetical protein
MSEERDVIGEVIEEDLAGRDGVAAPEGWRLIPAEPTREMLAAGVSVAVGVVPIYAAMLAAAPTPPASDDVPVSRELLDEAERCAFVLENIGSMDAEDIDGDDIDLRFEDEDGRDTGCDVSIVEYAERVAKVLRALLANGGDV